MTYTRRVKSLLPWGAALFVACASERSSPAPVRDPLQLRAPDELLADLSLGGEALVARELPPPEESDADRTVTLRWLTTAGARPWRFHGVPVLEARFLPRDGALLVLTTRHALVALDAPNAEPRVLDEHVYGPLSLDDAGRRVAYTRGEPPELQVIVYDLAGGVATPLAPSLVPSWSPALSADGTEVLVAASPEGSASFWRLRPGSPAQRWDLPADTPMPTGVTAPVLFGDAVVYESEGALRVLGLDGRLRRSLPGVPVALHRAGRAALVAQDARRRVVTLRPSDLEPSP